MAAPKAGSIVGSARGGKSFLIDLLNGTEGVFTLDNGGPCTEGVDMSPALLPHAAFAARFGARPNAKAPPIRFLDVEGSGNKGEEYDVRLYVGVLLLSKVCILNLSGHMGKQTFLSRVAALTAAAESLDLAKGRTRSEAPLFGHLHVVCRNFQFKGAETKEYERYIWEDEAGDDAKDRNYLRKQLKRSFKSITVHLFPKPEKGLDQKRIPWAQINDDKPFQASLTKLGAAISDQLSDAAPARAAAGAVVLETGAIMASVLRVTLEKVNQGDRLAIPDLWETLCQAALAKEKQAADDFADELPKRFPLKPADLAQAIGAAARQRATALGVQLDTCQASAAMRAEHVALLEAHLARARAGLEAANAVLVGKMCSGIVTEEKAMLVAELKKVPQTPSAPGGRISSTQYVASLAAVMSARENGLLRRLQEWGPPDAYRSATSKLVAEQARREEAERKEKAEREAEELRQRKEAERNRQEQLDRERRAQEAALEEATNERFSRRFYSPPWCNPSMYSYGPSPCDFDYGPVRGGYGGYGGGYGGGCGGGGNFYKGGQFLPGGGRAPAGGCRM
ncbi:hypothetical protein KFL_000440110 [Klebsormidium nitens]|uniref:Guanylate-binding protein N-terminal domain-containing protein n=1 Tax=Klebsormidium nitens TaxID=105231 RepID=A0A1Y1HS55_KLENI|nr:hypothetical protein KFL_000440110 [Klebsormidium nitens]|eukprot:GAQ80009.1 hypothetical protein KFL_000440110 [Klebsormidium nitens]